MTLGLTQEHAELAAAVRGWAERNCPPDLVRAAADSDDGGAEICQSRRLPGRPRDPWRPPAAGGPWRPPAASRPGRP